LVKGLEKGEYSSQAFKPKEKVRRKNLAPMDGLMVF